MTTNEMTTEITLTITADRARKSTCVDTAGAVDVDVSIQIGEAKPVAGEVTLCPAQYDGRLAAWGSVDNWVSDHLVKLLRGLGERAMRDALNEIEASAVAEATEA